MPLTSDTPCCPANLVWFHAVNSRKKVNDMIQAMKLLSQTSLVPDQKIPFAVEIDIHAAVLKGAKGNYVAVARHDATTEEEQHEETVESILSEISWSIARESQLHSAFCLCVIKLDIKSPCALSATYRLVEEEGCIARIFKLLERQRIWFNADVLRGPVPPTEDDATTSDDESAEQVENNHHVEDPEDRVPQSFARQRRPLSELTPSDGFLKWRYDELVRWLVRIGQQCRYGLSLGWTTHPSLGEPYGELHIRRMRLLLQDVCGGPVPLLTFPVRFSLVFSVSDSGEFIPTGSVVELKRLMLYVASNGVASQCFLTFWRGRAESFTDEAVTLARQTFPTATVDRD